MKTLRYNALPAAPMAFGLLTDADWQGTALFVVPYDAKGAVRSEFDHLISSCELQTWCWDASGPRPALLGKQQRLPAPDSRPALEYQPNT